MQQYSIHHGENKIQTLNIPDKDGNKVTIEMDEQTATSIALALLNNPNNTYSDPIVFLSPSGKITTICTTRENIKIFNGGEYDIVDGDLAKRMRL